jgi:hypothetical protein
VPCSFFAFLSVCQVKDPYDSGSVKAGIRILVDSELAGAQYSAFEKIAKQFAIRYLCATEEKLDWPTTYSLLQRILFSTYEELSKIYCYHLLMLDLYNPYFYWQSSAYH